MNPDDIWDSVGKREYETGIDRGVVYPDNGPGTAWFGLTGVSMAPQGGTPTAYYQDGINHLNEPGTEQFSGTITAFTYPDEFAVCDGTYGAVSYMTSRQVNGLLLDQQERKPFHLTYRTKIGSDVDGLEHGYKIHLIYNALASPSPRDFKSLSNVTSPLTFSWAFTTTPEQVPPFRPTSKLTIDSRLAPKEMVEELEDILYGLAPGQLPRFPSMSEVLTIFDEWPSLEVAFDPSSGMNQAKFSTWLNDLRGNISQGLFTRPDNSRIKTTGVAGIFTF